MADLSTCPPLIPSSVRTAYTKIQQHIHRTPLLTSRTLDLVASSPDPAAYLAEDPTAATASSISTPEQDDAPPRLKLFFKAENFQKIGAFKARGAFHALVRLVEELGLEEVRRRGLVTHSSGNHAQALALAAHTFQIPSYIVMPSISTPSKIAGTRLYTSNVIFSGSTSQEREAVVQKVIAERGAILVPPYDHPDIILGQATVGLEMEEQFQELTGQEKGFDAVVAPIGGGGFLGGIATWFADKPSTLVFGAEPSFQGADDARRGLLAGKRIETVKSLTIADGLRTPVGLVNWGIISDKTKLEGIYAVSEEEIKAAMRLVFERMKVVVEPSAVVPLAVVLFNPEFRQWVAERQQGKTWDVGVVFSGGNTTMKAISALFSDDSDARNRSEQTQPEVKLGVNGERR